jgi:pentatricopeptide repeat protein
MSLRRSLDRTSAVSIQLPLLPFLCPALYRQEPARRTFSKSAVTRKPRVTRPSQLAMDNFFISALVRASSCPEHAKHISTKRDLNPSESIRASSTTTLNANRHHKKRWKSFLLTNERRGFKTITRQEKERKGQFNEKELKALLDYYAFDHDSSKTEEATTDDGPFVWSLGDDHEPQPFKSAKDEAAAKKLQELLKDEETPHHQIYGTYRELPVPGVVYLHTEVIRSLLHHLAIVERPTPIAMQRFLSVLDDMKNANIHITRSEWTTAIHLAGRYLGAVSNDEVQSALHLWREMEKKARIRGGIVTMNVLFDIAVKAGKYTLAETFLKEMVARRIKFHRHFRVSLIYYHGVQLNGSGVRRAYSDLIDAGDVVDTVVMNAVIAALFRAGEPAAAEQVFERMKRLHASKSDLPIRTNNNPPTWRARRHVGLHLTHTARMLAKASDVEKFVEKLKELQDAAPIAPNSRTYSLLLRHHARVVGDIDRCSDLLREMGYNGVPVEGSIFIAMFHAFARFGGVRYSSWTKARMEQTWQEYLEAVRNRMDRTWVSRMAIVSALRAFAKCDEPERVARAWEEVGDLWDPSPVDLEGVLKVLAKLGPKRDGWV